MMFLNFVKKGADIKPYRKWSFNKRDILDSSEMTTYIICIILKQLNKYQYLSNNRKRTFNLQLTLSKAKA